MILFLLLLVLLLLPAPVLGRQDPPKLPEVRFVGGRLDATFVPYGKPFRIKGSTALPTGAADIVTLQISSDGGDPEQNRCWIRPAGDQGTEFELVTGRPLKLDRDYEFSIRFYQSIPSAVVLGALDQTLGTLRAMYAAAGQITDEELADSLQVRVERRIGAAGRTSFDVSKAGECTVRSEPVDLFRPGSAFLRDLGLMVSSGGEATQGERGLQALRDNLETLGNREDDQGQSLLVALAEALRDIQRPVPDDTEYPFLGAADVTAFLQSVGDAEERRDEAARQRFELFLEEAAQRDEQNGPLSAELRAYYLELCQELGAITDRMAAVAADQAHADSLLTHARSLIRDTPDAVLNPGYVLGLKANTAARTWDTQARIKTLRIGTAYAYGGVFPGLESGTVLGVDPDFASFLFVRVRLGHADYDLPDPYTYSGAGRWAVDLGMLFQSKVHYGGTELSGVFTDMTPTLGMSYEPKRRLTIHGGMMLFRQPSPNPFNTSTLSSVKLAPYLLLGVDFDLVNTLKTAGGS